MSRTAMCERNGRRVSRLWLAMLFLVVAFLVGSVKHEIELSRIAHQMDPANVGSWRHEMAECAKLGQMQREAIIDALGVEFYSSLTCTPLVPFQNAEEP